MNRFKVTCTARCGEWLSVGQTGVQMGPGSVCLPLGLRNLSQASQFATGSGGGGGAGDSDDGR